MKLSQAVQNVSRPGYLFYLSLAFLLSYTQLWAFQDYQPQTGDPFLEDWRWRSIPQLSGKGVRAISEDSTGTMWFIVSKGVMSYDGLNWQHFTQKDGLVEDNILSIAGGKHGEIYVSTKSTVCKYINNKWVNVFTGAPGLQWNFNHLAVTRDGTIWTVCEQGVLHIQDDSCILYTTFEWLNKLTELDLSLTYRIVPDMVLVDEGFRPGFIFEDNQERIWFLLRFDTIAVWDRTQTDISKPAWFLHTTKNGLANQFGGSGILYQSRDNRIWLINNNHAGIYVYDGIKWQKKDLVSMGSNNLHTSILETYDDLLMVGGARTVNVLQEGKWRYYEAPIAPIPGSRVLLHQARDGGLWIVGLRGDARRLDYSTKRWLTLKGLNYQCETEQGVQWFVDVEGGAVEYDGKTWKRYDTQDGLIDAPNGLIYTNEAGLWAAGSHKGVSATARFTNGRWKKQIHPELGYSIDPRNIVRDSEGNVYFGAFAGYNDGFEGGIKQFDPQKGEKNNQSSLIYLKPPHVNRSPYGIIKSPGGSLWFATSGGVQKVVNDQVVYIQTPALSDAMQAIDLSPSGDIWVGSRYNGVVRFDGDDWSHYTIGEGLPDNSVQSILCASDTTVWVATLNGISRFDGKEFLPFALHHDIKIRANGGLLKEGRDGSIWVNMASLTWYRRGYPGYPRDKNKFSLFQTVRYVPEKFPPETTIDLYSDKVSQPGNAVFTWSGHDFWEKTESSDLQYAYRIDDGPWSRFTSQTNNTFLELPDGDHILQVRARDKDLNVDSTPAEVPFHVVPPLWKQWWFISLLLAMLGFIIVSEIRILSRNKKIHELDLLRLNIFANISHELRTPLTLILGPLEKIMASGRGKKEQFQLIYRNAQRLLNLVNQTLDFQKIEYNALELTPIHGDVILFIQHLYENFKPYADEKKIEYELHTSKPSLIIDFDPDKLEKILFNLLSNAFKFTPNDGFISVTVNHQYTLSPVNNNQVSSDSLEIIVKDSGVGISKNIQPHIFERYFQAKNNQLEKRNSSGIGLALVKEIVELHKGTIRVESTEGYGSRFMVRLPLQPLREAATTHHITEERGEVKTEDLLENQHQCLILVVEDDADMRLYIKSELENNYHVKTAENGQKGIDMALEMVPDVIICDLKMPKRDGLSLCQELKENEITSHIPIIILTARHSSTMKLKALKMRADDYITKPFNMNELVARIENLIETRQDLQNKMQAHLLSFPTEHDVESLDSKFMAKAMLSVEKHISDPELNVEILSKEIGVSRVQLFRKIKGITSKTPNKFIRQIRLQKAAQLLQQTDLSVTEITYEVGFTDLHYFRKVFQKHFGKLPSHYRKSA